MSDDALPRQRLLKDIRAAASAGVGVKEACRLLRVMRRRKIVSPEDVISLSDVVLRDGSSEEELLAVAEQRCTAAMQIGRHSIVDASLEVVEKHFPRDSSQRVKLLVGMRMESRRSYDEAEKHYKDMLETNKANALVRKRLVCVALAKGQEEHAIRQLNEYLTIFPADMSGWLELGSLHEAGGRWKQAAFCYEEGVLLSPSNAFCHVKIAECKLHEFYELPRDEKARVESMEGIQLARRHAMQASKLSGRSYGRALWMLAAACTSFARLQGPQEGVTTIVPSQVLKCAARGAPFEAEVNVGTAVCAPRRVTDASDNVALFEWAAEGLEEAHGRRAGEESRPEDEEWSVYNSDGGAVGTVEECRAALSVLRAIVVEEGSALAATST